MTLGQGHKARGTRRNGQIKVAFLLGKSAVEQFGLIISYVLGIIPLSQTIICIWLCRRSACSGDLEVLLYHRIKGWLYTSETFNGQLSQRLWERMNR